ncbi:MAG: hypothetical protein KatS3mg090_0586 [Patescibacteria group bacterium]|nr:MAG: hypothetical protein KatS3mg090_0586 [Patescibacteria group bacterium]
MHSVAEYIKTALSVGKSKEDIYKDLLNNGFTIEVIETGFKSVMSEQQKNVIQNMVIRTIVVIGALFVCIGVFAFIASNWSVMSDFVKTACIVIFMILLYSVGWYFRERTRFSYVGSSLIFLGTLIYGAGLFLIAQIFNIRSNWFVGFILWMLGAVVMGFAVEIYWLFYLAVFLNFLIISVYIFNIILDYQQNLYLTADLVYLSLAVIFSFISGWVIKKRIQPEFKDFY